MGITEHISKQFDLDLDSIRSRVLQMGGLVEAQIRARHRRAHQRRPGADPTR